MRALIELRQINQDRNDFLFPIRRAASLGRKRTMQRGEATICCDRQVGLTTLQASAIFRYEAKKIVVRGVPSRTRCG
jgi:hypothetical protein